MRVGETSLFYLSIRVETNKGLSLRLSFWKLLWSFKLTVGLFPVFTLKSDALTL